jgi:transposase
MITIPIPTPTPAFFLGIDVGKPDLFCHLLGPDKTDSKRFDNTDRGIEQLLAWLSSLAPPDQLFACLEQTGHYGYLVSKALHALKISAIFLVNPRQIKAFGEQKLRRNKSDTADARLIAQFLKSEHLELRPWTAQSPDHEAITELSRYADSLTRDSARLKTKCEATNAPAVLRSLRRRIKAQGKELIDIRSRINKLIAKNQTLGAKFELLSSIPSLGEVTCHILLAELPPIALFSNARQLAAWAGVTPRHFVSGTSGKTRTPITKVGSAHLRRALFMPAMNARVFNPLLKTFADRLIANGKRPKQVIIAVMRKLLHQIYGILTSRTPYNPEKRGFQMPDNLPQTNSL